MTYAKNTTVSVDKSQAELKTILAKYGATAFLIGESVIEGHAFIEFMMQGRRFRMVLRMPDVGEFAQTPTRQRRSPDAQKSQWEQACRQRWRALILVVKAKLEAVECGIETLEQAFLGAMVLPDNGRVQDWLLPQIDEAYATGRMPPMLMPA